jgi:hypothetical protein
MQMQMQIQMQMQMQMQLQLRLEHRNRSPSLLFVCLQGASGFMQCVLLKEKQTIGPFEKKTPKKSLFAPVTGKRVTCTALKPVHGKVEATFMGMDAGGLGSAMQHVLHALGVHMGQHEAHGICRIVGFVRKSVDNPWRNHTCPFDGHTLPACVLQLIGADEHMHGPRGHEDTFVAEHGHQHLFHVP